MVRGAIAEPRTHARPPPTSARTSSTSTTRATTVRTGAAGTLTTLILVPDGDVVEVGIRQRQRDLVVRDRPVAGAHAELLDFAVRIVTAVGGHRILVPARLKLEGGRGIGAAVGGRPDERWRPGERARSDPAVESDLQVGALLRLERRLVRVARLRDEHQRHRARADREQRGDEDDGGLQPPPAKVSHGLDEDGGHRDASSLRTRITSEAARSGLSRRASSTIFPSSTLSTRAACRVASLASWVTSRIVCPSR